MKNEILQTALGQFLKFGIREMSIKKLIEPLGISTKTVYKYYKNKEELLEESLLFFYDQQFKLLENLTADQNAVILLYDIWYVSIERSYKVSSVFFQDLNYYYPELENKVERIIGDKFSGQLFQILQKGIKDGDFKEDILSEVVMEGIYTLYDSIARTDRFKKFNVSTHELFLNSMALYLRWCCTPKGILELDGHIQNQIPLEFNIL